MCPPTATNAADVPIDLKKNLPKREKKGVGGRAQVPNQGIEYIEIRLH